MKIILSVVAIILTFVAFIPYIRDIIKGTTKPHLFSWFIWVIVTGSIYALQVSGGAGSGAWITLFLTLMLSVIFILSLKNGNKNIKKIDIVFLVLALLAIALWVLVKQPVLSVVLLSMIDMLAFVPTIRKSWNAPYSETLSLYLITSFRYVLAILALQEYNVLTLLFPAVWLVANILFSFVLIMRRKKFPKPV